MALDYRGRQIPKRIGAVLFDFDGTLIDIMPKWWDPIERSFTKVTGSVPEDELRKNTSKLFQKFPVKPSKLFLLQVMWQIGEAGGLNPFQKIRFIRYSIADFRESRHTNNILPGVKEILDYLKDQKIPIGIVTSAKKEEILNAGIEHPILAGIPFISRDEVKNMKPHPESIQKAVEMLNVTIDNTVFVGDFRTDIIAGKAANVMTIAILGPAPEISQPIFEQLDPELILEKIEDLLPVLKNNLRMG